jgi:hypothetical protein
MATRLAIALLILWAAASSALLCFRRDISVALNNWILQRETMQGRTFLTHGNGPEGFVAFGNETNIFCGRACVVEELGENGEQGLSVCDSHWEGRKHMCAARFWPGRHYIVQAMRVREATAR